LKWGFSRGVHELGVGWVLVYPVIGCDLRHRPEEILRRNEESEEDHGTTAQGFKPKIFSIERIERSLAHARAGSHYVPSLNSTSLLSRPNLNFLRVVEGEQ